STGETLFPIGHNLPTYYVARYRPDVELAKMHAGGENYNRWWMYSRELGLEWEHALGWYRQMSAWRMDFLLRLAERLGFWYMLCLDTHQDFRGSKPWEGWPRNPYNAAMGGPCERPADFFTNPKAKAYYRKRLRYLVARYGWSTRVLCWEFGNEFEGWPGTPPEDLLAWHREMSDYLRRIDPYHHLITTSFWTPSGRDEIWSLPNLDIVQTHHYANSRVDMAQMVAADSRAKYEHYRKPHIYGEVGLDSRLRLENDDPKGYYLHNVIWAGLMSGAASTPMSWWHESYIDKYGLYGVYRGLAEFVRDVPLARYHWRPVELVSARWLEQPKLAPGDLALGGQFGWGKPEVTRFELSPLGEVDDPTQVPSLLQGQGHRDLQQPVTFVVTYPRPGKFVLHVDRVSNSGLVKVYLDGKLAAEFDLPCGEGLGKQSVWREQWKLWETVYDKDLVVPVPAGKHEIRVENEGKDWVRVSEYRFVGARGYGLPDHLVLGLRSGKMVLLWVRNRDFTWFNAEAGKVQPRPPCRLVLGDVAAGVYSVETWDPWEGKVIARTQVRASGGKLELDVPGLTQDIAFKLIREETGR
ncbi:MAG: cellulase family glycosylhydrolase, partial [Armatimonadetes bacterium]|nr:cellulase family glycosylhydrolase [Armatimonadota bacterium]